MLFAVTEGKSADMVIKFWKRFNIRKALLQLQKPVVIQWRVTLSMGESS